MNRPEGYDDEWTREQCAAWAAYLRTVDVAETTVGELDRIMGEHAPGGMRNHLRNGATVTQAITEYLHAVAWYYEQRAANMTEEGE